MWLKDWPFDIVGKLSCTPEEAKEMFDFYMDPDAIGIVFQRYRKRNLWFTKTPRRDPNEGRVYIKNLFPKRDPKTYLQLLQREKLRILSKIASSHLNDLIYPIWSPLSKLKCYAYQTFISKNMQSLGLPPIWQNMIISLGPLQPPKIYYTKSLKNKSLIFFESKIQNPEIGIATLDPNNPLNFSHLSPKNYSNPVTINLKYSPILYLYLKKDEQFSSSISLKIKNHIIILTKK